MVGSVTSLAVTVKEPDALNVTFKVRVPLLRSTSAGRVALPSLLARWMV